MLNKILFAMVVLASSFAYADPVVGGLILPPASFTHIESRDLLVKIGLDGSGGAWCYDEDANAILITGPARERAHCELKLKYELERQKIKLQFRIDNLNVRIKTLTKQYEEILFVKDAEIEKLTTAAMKRPNDYSAWWATGGVVTGAVLTLVVSSLL